MNSTHHQPTSVSAPGEGVGGLRILAPLLGLATTGWLLVYGLALDAPGVVPLGILALLPAVALAAVLGSRVSTSGNARWSLALMPVAMGIVVVTLLVGTLAVPDLLAWWVVGGVLACLPFVLVRRV